MLNSREIHLLKILIEQRQSLTTEIIGNYLNVTSRTVKSDIKSINQKLLTKEIQIITKKGKGIWLKIPPNQESWIYDYLYSHSTQDYKSINNKIYSIANYLLDFNYYILIDDICEHLFYSRSVITKELNNVDELLCKFHLTLLRNNLGIFIEGEEKDIRIAQVTFYKKLHKDIDFNKLKDMIYFKNIKIQGLYDIILEIEGYFKIQLNDKDFQDIFYYLAIMIIRYKTQLTRRKFIDLTIQEYNDFFYSLSIYTIKRVCLLFDIEYWQEDVLYFYWYLLGLSIFPKQGFNKKLYEQEEIYYILTNVLIEIDKIYGIQLSSNKHLIQNLYKHLMPAIYRSKYQIFIENPLLTELKRTFAYAFEISLLIIKRLEKYLDVHFLDDEIGLFTMHIAAALEKNNTKKDTFNVSIVCTIGKGVGEFLKARIESLFENIKVACVFTTTRIEDNILLENVHFIISTVFLDNLNIPVVFIAPMLKEKDIEKIKVMTLELQEKNKDKINSLYKLFDKNISFFQVNAKDKNQILKMMCSTLIKEHYGTSEIYESLLKREKISGTAIGQLIAIPHPYSEVILKSGIAVAVLKEPIVWGDERVQIIFLLCINANDNKNLKIIMENIFNIAQNYELVNQLRSCHTIDHFIKSIHQFE